MMKIKICFFMIFTLIFLTGCNAPETDARQNGGTEHFSCDGLEVEVSNVSKIRRDRFEGDMAGESGELEYSVFTCSPGAAVTVLNADTSDWAFDRDVGAPIDIINGMEPIEITWDILGIYHKEKIIYALIFELEDTELEESEEPETPPPQIAGPLPDEYQTGEFWRRIENSGELLSLPDGETPESYFEQVQIYAEAEAERYIRDCCLPQREAWQAVYGSVPPENWPEAYMGAYKYEYAGQEEEEKGPFYEDFRLEYLAPGGVYVKNGARYLVYTLRYQLKAVPGARIYLMGDRLAWGQTMAQSVDGWVSMGWDSTVALTLEDNGNIRLYWGRQIDIFPSYDEELFQSYFSLLLAEQQGDFPKMPRGYNRFF